MKFIKSTFLISSSPHSPPFFFVNSLIVPSNGVFMPPSFLRHLRRSRVCYRLIEHAMRFSKSAIPWRQSDYGMRLKWTRVQTTDSIFDPFTNRIRSFHEFLLEEEGKKSAEYLTFELDRFRRFQCNSTIIFFFFFIFKARRGFFFPLACLSLSNHRNVFFPLYFEFPLSLIYNAKIY